jgi:hypothetical protein
MFCYVSMQCLFGTASFWRFSKTFSGYSNALMPCHAEMCRVMTAADEEMPTHFNGV